MVRAVAVLLAVGIFMAAESANVLYETLAEPLRKSGECAQRLSTMAAMEPNAPALRSFAESVQQTLSVGRELSGARVDGELAHTYLANLRELTRTKEKIDTLYRQSLTDAIENTDKKRFEELLSVSSDVVHHPRLRSEVIAFYEKNYPKNTIQTIERLCDEQKLEAKSLQMAIEQEAAYEEHLKILKRAEAERLKKTAKLGSRNSVLLSADATTEGGYAFEAENLNPFTVTLNVDFTQLDNLKASAKLPFFIEIPGKTRKEILTLSRISPSAPATFRSSYGWVRGSAFAVHRDDYLYRLPFANGMGVSVSQGYHGDTSHKGLSAYAVDFPVPIGTPIHAAREGIVVGAEGSNTLGAPSPEYRQFANYVIIEHDDGTMGNYFHLKQGGTAVEVGQKVKRGDLVGYSGNTGYTSGPHLHFSVSKVDPVSMRRPMNLPVRMQTAQGIVMLPRKGDQYTVQ